MLPRAMHDQNLAILKGLVCVAWADGKVATEEMDIIEGLLAAFSATPSEIHEVRQYAKVPRTIEDVPLTDLNGSDRRMLLHHAVLVSYADGEQSDAEVQVLKALAERLHVPAAEAQTIFESGKAHAKSVLHLLGAG